MQTELEGKDKETQKSANLYDQESLLMTDSSTSSGEDVLDQYLYNFFLLPIDEQQKVSTGLESATPLTPIIMCCKY